jgi:acetolactate synthase-1/2/3 large subunit
VKLAESMGCKGLKCTDISDLEFKMKEFLECDGPVLLECLVCEHEHVYPMVPAGKALHEVIFC